MVKLHITSKDIKKSIYLIVLFNTVFPKILEESNLIINIEDANNPSNVQKMTYTKFISTYDYYGLNLIAE